MATDKMELQKRGTKTIVTKARNSKPAATKTAAAQSDDGNGLRFCGQRINFTDADVSKAFAKVKTEDIPNARTYYVKVKGVEKPLPIPAVIERLTGIKLEWKQNPKSGSINGTYSTGNAAKLLARMGVSVFGKDGTRVVYTKPEAKAKVEAPAKSATKAAAKKVAATKTATKTTTKKVDAKAAATNAVRKAKAR